MAAEKVEGENQPQSEIGVLERNGRYASRRVTRTSVLVMSWGSHRFSPLTKLLYHAAWAKDIGVAYPIPWGGVEYFGFSGFGCEWSCFAGPFVAIPAKDGIRPDVHVLSFFERNQATPPPHDGRRKSKKAETSMLWQ